MLYLFFQITVASYVRIVQHAKMHTEFSNPLSSRNIVKPYVTLDARLCIGNIEVLGRREGMREETLSVPSNKVSVLPARIFLFRLYNPTSPQSRMFRGDYLSECVFSTSE